MCGEGGLGVGAEGRPGLQFELRAKRSQPHPRQLWKLGAPFGEARSEDPHQREVVEQIGIPARREQIQLHPGGRHDSRRRLVEVVAEKSLPLRFEVLEAIERDGQVETLRTARQGQDAAGDVLREVDAFDAAATARPVDGGCDASEGRGGGSQAKDGDRGGSDGREDASGLAG